MLEKIWQIFLNILYGVFIIILMFVFSFFACKWGFKFIFRFCEGWGSVKKDNMCAGKLFLLRAITRMWPNWIAFFLIIPVQMMALFSAIIAGDDSFFIIHQNMNINDDWYKWYHNFNTLLVLIQTCIWLIFVGFVTYVCVMFACACYYSDTLGVDFQAKVKNVDKCRPYYVEHAGFYTDVIIEPFVKRYYTKLMAKKCHEEIKYITNPNDVADVLDYVYEQCSPKEI